VWSVHNLDGRPIRSCITPVSNVVGKKITTVEAIGQTESGAKIQRAWLNIEVVQCERQSCLPLSKGGMSGSGT
jgi:aerobic-type carbon monoxide dehydrogenase small subunit (CoxS/CutS family)